MPKISLPFSLSPSASFRPRDRSPQLASKELPALLRTINSNQRRADDLIHFLESCDPGARLDEDIRQNMLATLRKISNNTSIQDIPLPRFRSRAALQLPLKNEDMAAVYRDEATLNRLTDQLRMHAHAMLDKQAQRVREHSRALETLYKGKHPTMSALADRFIHQTIPFMQKTAQGAPHIAGEMRFAEQLLTRIEELIAAYLQIDAGYQTVAAHIPLDQNTCDGLVQPLKRAQHFADQLSMSDCRRSLLQFDVRLMRLRVEPPADPS